MAWVWLQFVTLLIMESQDTGQVSQQKRTWSVSVVQTQDRPLHLHLVLRICSEQTRWHSACLQMSHSRSCWTVQHLLSRTARSNTTHVSDTILLKVLLFPEKVRSLQTALRSSRRSAANRLHLLLSADLARQTEDIKDMDTPQLLRSFPQHFSPVSS